MLFQSFAAGNSTISGVAFKDMNRNGVMDAGEEPFSGHRLYFFNETSTAYLGTTVTGTNGQYSLGGLADGRYQVSYEYSSWQSIYNDWVPTTTGSLSRSQSVTVTGGQGTANYGWRPIVKSTDYNNPISQATMPSGLKISIYNDALTPNDVYSELQKGSLLGVEQKSIQLSVAGPCNCNATASGAGGTPGSYTNYSANANITWEHWVTQLGGQRTLFHEYGHAWSLYYAYMVQQDDTLNGYLKARGLDGDPRINSSYGWNTREIIADDYRILFGPPEVGAEHMNREITPPKDVPGLEDYLRNTFTKSPAGGILSAPSGLSASTSLSPEGPTVQLSWTASTGSVSTYDIYRTDPGTAPRKIGYVNSPSTTYYDGTGLANSTSYSYYVKAISTDGSSSAASNTVSVTTPAPDSQKPTAPSGLMSTGVTNSSISLQWIASSDNVGVKEYRIYQDSRKLQPVLKGTVTGTNFTVTGLKANAGYIFYVTAVDAAGNESLPSKSIGLKTKR